VDIIMYKAFGVPVGVDQLPHVELTREIARRFNFLYGEIFPIPEPLLTEVPKLLGIDGRKMSKSYDNSIFMSDRGDSLRKKIAAMFTDPQRQRKSDPGRPELCNVFTFHQLYSPPEDVSGIAPACRGASIGCTECKRRLAAAVEEGMRPVHERRDYYLARPEEVRAVIEDGNRRAAAIAQATLAEVREALKISHEL
jgi:tryptophanyl-tRNA synthetase